MDWYEGLSREDEARRIKREEEEEEETIPNL